MKIIDIPQGSDLWHEWRFRRVTGTKLQSAIGACFSSAKNHWVMGGFLWKYENGSLVKSDVVATDSQNKASASRQSTLLIELVAEYQSELEIDDYQSAEMERGNELEPVSVAAASEKHKIKFETCGALQSDTIDEFGFSPDAIFKDDNGVIVGGYETKSKSGKTHIEWQIANILPPEHLIQCLCPMVMDDCIKWWLFGHYDDRNHVNPLFTVGIKRSDVNEFVLVAREVLANFIIEVKETVKELGGAYNG